MTPPTDLDGIQNAKEWIPSEARRKYAFHEPRRTSQSSGLFGRLFRGFPDYAESALAGVLVLGLVLFRLLFFAPARVFVSHKE